MLMKKKLVMDRCSDDAVMLQARGEERHDVGHRMAPLGGWRGRARVGNGDSAEVRTGVGGDAGGLGAGRRVSVPRGIIRL